MGVAAEGAVPRSVAAERDAMQMLAAESCAAVVAAWGCDARHASQGAVFQSVVAGVPTPQVWQPRAALQWWQPGAVLQSVASKEAALLRTQPMAVLRRWQLRDESCVAQRSESFAGT